MRRTLWPACSILLAVLGVTPASAQTEPPPPEPSRLRLRIGQLTINPTIGLTNIGFDQNVFNEPDSLNPKADFTFTVTPAVDLRYRLLRTQLIANVREDLVWYQTYSSERAANNATTVNWFIPFNRVSFKLNGRYADLRDRPGFEIDARSQRTEIEYGGAVEVRGHVSAEHLVHVNVIRGFDAGESGSGNVERNIRLTAAAVLVVVENVAVARQIEVASRMTGG